MQLTVEFHLKTREVYKLLELTIHNNRSFIDAISRKLNIIHAQNDIYQQIDITLQTATTLFIQEIASLENIFGNKATQIKAQTVIPQYHVSIIVTNRLGLSLVAFIKSYDSLIALLKLLHFAACFNSDKAYYTNLKRIRKMGNRILSNLLLTTIKINR